MCMFSLINSVRPKLTISSKDHQQELFSPQRHTTVTGCLDEKVDLGVVNLCTQFLDLHAKTV